MQKPIFGRNYHSSNGSILPKYYKQQQMNFKNFTRKLFSIETVAVVSVLFVYGFILSYMNRGISCDEGFYLLGFLKNQELGPMVSDFHSIIRAITPDAMQDNVMYFRYLRFGLGLTSVLLFGLTSYYWLKNRIKTFRISRLLYVSLILLGGAISYTYAAPTISHDHLQHIIYFFAFSAFISADLAKNKLIQIASFLLTGIFLVFGIANYLPSGILLFAVFVALIIILHFNKSAIHKILLLCAGVLFGFVLYHFLINPLDVVFGNINTAIETASDTRHDSASLFTAMLAAVTMFLLVQIPTVAAGYFARKINIHTIIIATATVVLVGSFFFFRDIFQMYAHLYYLPVSFVLGVWLAEKKSLTKDFNFRNYLVLLIFSFLPFMGIFGTNQAIIAKAMLFIPFWMCLFLVIVDGLKISDKQNRIFIIFIIVLYAVSYLMLGNFSRYHSYYSPRSSRYEMVFGVRYKNVQVSRFEKEYFRTFAETLDSIGFRSGNTALAFGEQQIGLYLMGGYFHGGLVYSINQYVNIPAERARFIFLFRKEEERLKEHLKNSGWNFPEDYTRIELGRMAENLVEGKHETVIYFIKTQ